MEVRATPLADTVESIALPVEILTGARLDQVKAGTLGETVGKLPGVQSSSFGPSVGRPIIRGLDGARVQVLSDGLSSGDVSTVSVDHAVSIEPFLADQIEVLKGPATLLYGSGAIGGAVNVIDGRIPERRAEVPFQGRAEVRYDGVNNGRTGMVRVGGDTGTFAFHFDAVHREGGDYRIPGFAESAALLAEEGETPDPAEAGRLPNSAARNASAAFGLSWIGDRGFIGSAYSLYNSHYGIPGHASHAEEAAGHAGEAHEGDVQPVRIVLDQRRTELRGGIDGLGVFDSMRVKLADTEYTHTEFEGEAIGTVFDNRSTEARVELVHAPYAGWKGAFGVQASRRDFNAVGAEAFVPASVSNDTGVFWLGKRAFGDLQFEAGLRYGRNRVAPSIAATGAAARRFSTVSGSAGLVWKATDALHVNLGLDRAQRAPTPEELYSRGLHVATASFELGTAGLNVETAQRAELGLHWHTGPVEVHVSAYRTGYADFIYLAATDTEIEGLPVRLWRQGDARFTGAEAKLDWDIAENASGLWSLELFGDAVRARLGMASGANQAFSVRVSPGEGAETASGNVAIGGNLPRIVPARAGARLRWERDGWRASIGAVRTAQQDHIAAYESATAGYTLVDAHLAWHVDTSGGRALEIFLDGSNLTNREARPHVSFLKDLAPLPGRGISAGIRAFF